MLKSLKRKIMKKYSILFLSILLLTNSISAQEKSKKVTDTAHACKPTKAGKHCAAPVKKVKQ